MFDKAEQLERLYGTEKASRWYKAATADTDTLAELVNKWMEVSDYKASVRGWPTYSYLPDLIVLGLFTGARENEICSLRAEDVEFTRTQAVMHVRDAKTKAGTRFVAVTLGVEVVVQ